MYYEIDVDSSNLINLCGDTFFKPIIILYIGKYCIFVTTLINGHGGGTAKGRDKRI